jgi:hypothetical protein
MAESLVGRRTPVTRQKGGRPVTGARISEIASVPEVTGSAMVMVVFSKLSDFSEPQSAAFNNVAQADRTETPQQTRTKEFKRPPEGRKSDRVD